MSVASWSGSLLAWEQELTALKARLGGCFLVVSCGRRAQISLMAFFPALSARQAG
jgi:hypothetical protein